MLPLLLAMGLSLQAPICEDYLSGWRSSEQVTTDTRARAMKACAALGATPEACRVVDAMISRESSADPCAIHVLGKGEYGKGILGMSCKWQSSKWAGNCDDFLLPEISVVVALRIFRRAVSRHGAATWVQVNEVFATGKLGWRPMKQYQFCKRLLRAGVSCFGNPEGQLGEALGKTSYSGQWRDLEKALENE